MLLPRTLKHLAGVALAAASLLSAHDFYLLPDTFQVTPKTELMVRFQNGDSFPESEAAPSLARVKEPRLRFGNLTTDIQGVHTDGKRLSGTVRIPDAAGTFLLSAWTTPNLIELAPDKFRDYLKEEGLAEVIAWREAHGESAKPGRERYSKYAKALLNSGAPSEGYRFLIGFPIEILPESNPYLLHAGSELPVQVLLRGKPANGLQLEAAWFDGKQSKTVVVGKTDAHGRIRVPIAAPGKWRLHSLKMERCAEPNIADWESFWGSLTFEVR